MQNRQVTIVSINNPFNYQQRSIELQAYNKRKKLSSYLRDNTIVREGGVYSVSVNGRILDKCEYNLPVPCNSYIAVIPIVAGGDDGKAILGIIASIALSVAAASIYSGVLKTTESAILAGLAAGATTFVGGLIVNAITPQPKIDMTSTKQSSTYSWGQGTPIGNQGGAVGITYGRVRPSIQVLAQHISTEGDKQYMNLLLCGGEGAVDSVSDIKVNDNPISNYKNVQLDIRLGSNDQAVIPNFNDQYADQGLSFELGREYSKQAINSNATQGIEITVELPAGLFYSNDKGGLDGTWVDIEADYRLLEAEEWTPFVRTTTAYYPKNRGIEVIGKGAAGVYRFVESAPNGDTRHVYISGPNGYRKEVTFASGWGTVDIDVFRINKDIGILDGVDITVALSNGRISAAQTSALRRTYRMDNLDAGGYEVRVACVAKGGDSTRHSNKVYWTQVSSIVYDDMARPGKVLVGIRALATSQLSGGIPKISWIQERKLVWVYVADKGYVQMPADNPAWAAYDLIHRCKQLRDVRTGEDVFSATGAPYDRIIYREFAEWAEFCESKKLKLNLFIDTAADLWSKLQYIEEVGRGKTTLKGTRFGCICDKPSQAVQMFTMGNILSGSFSEDFLPMRDRANAVEITFNNAARDYERDTLIVYADDYDTSQEVKNPTQIALDGVTDFDQAFREAKYRLYLNRYLIRTISFEANVDSIACQVGDVIKFQHDVPQWGYGGRILEVYTDSVKLDQVVSMESGSKYMIMVRKSATDELLTLEVLNGPGDTDTLSLSNIPELSVGDLYTFGEAGIEAKPFRVVAITRSADMYRRITAIEYHEAVYSEGYEIPTLDYSDLDKVIDVKNLIVNQDTYRQKDGTLLSSLYVNWDLDRAAQVSACKVFYSTNNGVSWEYFGDTADRNCVISGVKIGSTYIIKVCAISSGFVSGGVLSKPVYVTGKDNPPSDVSGLSTSIDSNNSAKINLQWSASKDLDLQGYYVYEGDELLTALPIVENRYSYLADATRIFYFSVVGVDTSFNCSMQPAKANIYVKLAPDTVQGFAAIQQDVDRSKLNFSWTAVRNTDLAHYELRQGANWETAVLIGGQIRGTQYQHQLVQEGNFTYLIKAVNNQGYYSEQASSINTQVILKAGAPNNVQAVQNERDRSFVIVSWQATLEKDISYYEIYNSGTVLGITKERSFSWQPPSSGSYDLSVVAVTVSGQRGHPANVRVAVMLEPYDVSGFTARQSQQERSSVILSWDNPLSTDVAYFEIREGASWDTGTVVGERVTGVAYTARLSKEDVHRFWIKAVSIAGFYSKYPAMVSTEFSLAPKAVAGLLLYQSPDDKSQVIIKWSPTEELDIVGYEIRLGNVWADAYPLAYVKESYYTYTALATGSQTVLIKAKNAVGFYSAESRVSGYITLEPTSVSGFVALQNGEYVDLHWDKHSEQDVIGYELREGLSFDTGVLVATGITTGGYTIKVSTERVYRYHIKAINKALKYSIESVSASVYVDALPPKNVVKSYNELELKSGECKNVEFSVSALNFQTFGGSFDEYPNVKFGDVGGLNVLRLTKIGSIYQTSGTYTGTIKDLGQIVTANISADFRNTVLMYDVGAAALQLRTSRDGTNWTEWQDFKPAQYTLRYLQARVMLATTDTNKSPEVNQLTIAVDVPDNIQSGKISIPVGGKTVAFNREYYDVPVVMTMAIGENRFFQRTATSKQGFTGKVVDRNGNDVGGTIDWQAKGY